MDSSEEHPPARCGHCGGPHPRSFSHCPKTGRPLHAGRALVGRVIAGRYRIVSLLGEGGMGAVYVAENLSIGRKVALKRLHPELMGDDNAVRRFEREARAAAATGHEHIVEVLDLGFGEDGAPFLVMEYLRGRSLARTLREDGRLEPERACRIAGQVLAALDAVHERGIVHRDLKPDNVILTRRRGDSEFVKVVDFGISKMRPEEGGDGLALTRTGVTLGTPFYMSPEQARGMKDLDHRVDLYGVGVILYESITGRLPFDGDNYHQLLQAILSGRRPAVGDLRPEISESLASIIERSIALDRNERHPSARALLEDLLPHGAIDPGPESIPPPPVALTPLEDAKTTPIGREATRASTEAVAPTVGASSSRSSRPRANRPRGLAPEPGAMASAPRRFSAQSPGWKPLSTPSRASELPSSAREPVLAYSREEPRDGAVVEPSFAASMITPADDSSEGTRVKGSLLLSALEVLGDARETVLERLGPATAQSLRGVILPMAWLPLGVYVELLRAGERAVSSGDGILPVRVGQATADRELTTTHRLFMQSATPTVAVERIAQIFRAYHAPGRVEVQRSGGGNYRVEAHGLSPDSLVHALAMSGFYQRMLELAGAQDVRAAVVTCRERGDASTVTTLRWR